MSKKGFLLPTASANDRTLNLLGGTRYSYTKLAMLGVVATLGFITMITSYLLVRSTRDIIFVSTFLTGVSAFFGMSVLIGSHVLTSLLLASEVKRHKLVRADDVVGEVLMTTLKAFGKPHSLNTFLRWVVADNMRHLKLTSSCHRWDSEHSERPEAALRIVQADMLDLAKKFADGEIKNATTK
ncbi:MAG TPA: hypothetical protein VFO38_02705 [Candidatus Saccharimonadales bacterium]|nr:hypothetical protein [Candidatus Saccharimonadales bacterium]